MTLANAPSITRPELFACRKLRIADGGCGVPGSGCGELVACNETTVCGICACGIGMVVGSFIGITREIDSNPLY
jgi:hypothetical protein